MSKSLEQQVRDQAAAHLSLEVAQCAQLSLEQLKLVPYGGQPLSHEQVQRLARRMSIPFVWTEEKRSAPIGAKRSEHRASAKGKAA